MCTSMLMDLFSCCFPRKRSRTNQPDERTYLIPTEPQSENRDDETIRRQRALEDRLTEIVRAKEGKMVNLHARLPFNLHNRTTSSLSARLDPSSSRSGSDSLLASPAPTSPRYPISYAVNHHQYHYTSPLGFVDERRSSASRSSSRLTPHAGQYPHDHEPGVGDHGDGVMDEDREDHPHEDRLPILNLRLVNPNPAFGIGTSNKPALTRGRSPLKYATTVEQEPSQSTLPPPPPPPPPQSPRSNITEPGGSAHEYEECENAKSPTSTVGPNAVDFNSKTSMDDEQLVVTISPASTSSFKIQETTPLILNWES